MTIGERIKQRRQELGLTQEELARRLGNKTRASVCTVERDKEDLTTDRVEKYAAALECSPAYLMGYVNNPDPSAHPIVDAALRAGATVVIKNGSESDLQIQDDDEQILIRGFRAASPDRKEDMLEMAKKALKREDSAGSSRSAREVS